MENKQINIKLGKINTNKIKALIRSIEWAGKTRTELKTYLDYTTGEYKQSSTELTEVFGDIDNKVKEFLNLVYESHKYIIDESNFKIVMLELEAYKESYTFVVNDIRKTEEELKKEKAININETARAKEEADKKDAEIKASGNLTQSEKINIPIKEVAKRIRTQLKDKFKGCNFSVIKESYSGGDSIHINLMSADFDPFRKYEDLSEEVRHRYQEDGRRTEEELKALCSSTHAQLSQYTFREDYNPNTWNNGHFLTEKAHNILKEVVKIVNYYNWDNSDAMTDYFDVNFYLHLNIGKWDTPFKIVEAEAKTEPKKEIGSLEEITFNHNTEKNGLEVYFKNKPSQDVLNTLKDNGFRWGRFNKCWYKTFSEEADQEIKKILGVC